MSIRMIGLDLDGTALDGSRRFTDRLKRDFIIARQRGIHIVIATGRSICSLPPELYDTEGLEIAVTSNGARVIELCGKKTIYINYISPLAIDVLRSTLMEQDANVEIFTAGRAYISRREYDGIVSGTIKTRSFDYVTATRKPVDDIFSMMHVYRDKIENISINYQNDEKKRIVQSILSEIPGITLTSSFALNNEIGGETTSKADALRFLMDRFGISADELMVCGDSPNDIAMIELAGIGVAMGNASSEVKNKADYVTAPNYDEGAALAIEKYAL